MQDQKTPKVWMVRAGEGARFLDLFLDKNIIALGWNAIGKLPKNIEYDELKEKVREAYPDDSAGWVNQSSGQLWRFYSEFEIGDFVITYDPSARSYYTGKITSNYTFNAKLDYQHTRKVDWDKEVTYDRDWLSVSAKNLLGAILTIFKVSPEVWQEFEEHSPYVTEEELEKMQQDADAFQQQEEERIIKDLISRSAEFIKDLIVKLSWEEMEDLVAGVLSAMGYKIRKTSKGSDLGSDMLASPDGLGMTEPRIKVEVKHKIQSKEKVSSDLIRNFVGGLRTEKGIYVSTTGFSKEAKYEAERANFSITLIDSDLLIELLIENYENLKPEVKALVPLRKIYWPV